MDMKWDGYFEFVCRDKDGNIKWIDGGHNSLADQGEQNILDAYFRGQNFPQSFEFGLFNYTPIETDTPALLTGEPVGNGYVRVALTRDATGFPSLALDGGDYMVTSKVMTITAVGGTIGPVTHGCLIALMADASKKLVAFRALSQTRTLADGESIDITYRVKLS